MAFLEENLPKVGDPIPGTNLAYEAGDIENLREPTVISSLGSQRRVNDNKTLLGNAETALMQARQVQESSNRFMVEKGMAPVPVPNVPRSPQAPQQAPQPTGGAVRNLTGSPASQTIVDDVNNAVGGGITTDQQTSLTDIKRTEASALTNLAAARAAIDNKDYSTFNARIQAYKDAQKDYESKLTAFHTAIEPLRTRLTGTLAYGEEERQLQTKLADLRNQADTFKLQTEKDKMSEFEGQTLGFARGRASELDLKASFKMQEMALQEKNLLTRVGLLQEARQFEGKTVQQQLDFIKDDFELQEKIVEKLDKREEEIFDLVDKQSEGAKKTLFDLMKTFEGMDTEDMSPETKKQLQDISAQSGIDFGLVSSALEAQKNRYVYEQAIKGVKEKRAIAAEERAEKRLTLAEEAAGRRAPTSETGANYNARLNQEISNVFGGRYGTDGAREQAIGILQKEFPEVDVAKDIYNRVPDNFKAGGRMTASTLDPQTMNDILSDIQGGATLQQLYGAYPEVSPSLIQSLYYNQ